MKTIEDRSFEHNKYDGLTFIIKKPQNVKLSTTNTQGTVTITTAERSFKNDFKRCDELERRNL